MANNHKHKFAAVILAAGKGTRMYSSIPKVMHKLGGMPMIAYVMQVVCACKPEHAVLVVAPEMDVVSQAAKSVYPSTSTVIQDKQLGTGHAVGCAKDELKEYSGTVLVLYGDTPLITAQTINNLLTAAAGADITVLGMRLENPAGYGRMITDGATLHAIVEHKDASEEQKKINLCNSGIMAVKGAHLFALLDKLKAHNAAGEYYLTDIIETANTNGLRCRVIEADASELSGINSRAQLAEAECLLQHRLRKQAMEQGVTLVDPASVFLAADTKIAQDVIIHPHVVFGPGVMIESGTEIRSFCHIEGVHIKRNVIVGPFARLRPGSVLEEGSHVGNFVELKKTHLGKGAKANHLSYLGDSDIGAEANIGAGTITCNFDGVNKHKTTIGTGAFIGSNTALVAPVTVGAGAIVGAGSVITKDVEEGALALGRTEQVNKSGKASLLKKKQKKSG